MKKMLVCVGIVFFVLMLAACGGDTESTADVNGEANGNNGINGMNEQNEGNAENEANGNENDGQQADETLELRLAENHPDDYPTTIGNNEFARLVEEKTDGRIQIDVYAGGTLGDERSVIEQVQLGSIELARVNATPLTEFSDDIGVLAMPYLFESEEHMWNVLNGEIGDELLQTLESSNMRGLAFYDSGTRSFYNSERPVETPEDMEGLRIRVQESQLLVDMVEAFGASANPMAFEEVYSALETGVIDGAENNLPSYYTTSHYEVANYYTFNRHTTVPEVLMVSTHTWDELSEEDQQIFLEAARESVDVQREAWAELEEESKAIIEEHGNEFIEIDDIEPWREAVEPLYEEYGAQFQQWIKRIEQES